MLCSVALNTVARNSIKVTVVYITKEGLQHQKLGSYFYTLDGDPAVCTHPHMEPVSQYTYGWDHFMLRVCLGGFQAVSMSVCIATYLSYDKMNTTPTWQVLHKDAWQSTKSQCSILRSVWGRPDESCGHWP